MPPYIIDCERGEVAIYIPSLVPKLKLTSEFFESLQNEHMMWTELFIEQLVEKLEHNNELHLVDFEEVELMFFYTPEDIMEWINS